MADAGRSRSNPQHNNGIIKDARERLTISIPDGLLP